MAITKEQWEKIEAELSGFAGRVKLKCDEYDLTLSVVPVASLQYGISVHVNGWFRGKWLIEDCEERRRFLRPFERFVFNAKQRCEMIKIYGGKRAAQKDVDRINQKLTFYHSYWTSVKPLRRHLEKHNRELELVELGYVAVADSDDARERPAGLAVA